MLCGCPERAWPMWTVAHSSVHALRLPYQLQIPDTLPYMLHRITPGQQTVTSSRWISTGWMHLAQKKHLLIALFLCPPVQYSHQCSRDAGQPCFVCAREQACHLVAGRTYERTTVTERCEYHFHRNKIGSLSFWLPLIECVIWSKTFSHCRGACSLQFIPEESEWVQCWFLKRQDVQTVSRSTALTW
jgi:hypothetical protein